MFKIIEHAAHPMSRSPVPPSLPLLDSEVLRTFVAIAETGSFSRASEQLHRTPSAVSMQIKKLEGQLKCSLLSRKGKVVRPTSEGQALLGYARRILRLNQEAVALFRAPAIEGMVRLGSPADFGTRFMPAILARFAANHPGVEVDVVLDGSKALDEMLAKRRIDLTLLTCAPEDPLIHGGELVFTEPLAWTGLEGGVAHRREPMPLALSIEGCPWREAALTALDAANKPYRIAYESFHCAGQEAALRADLAVAPFPKSTIEWPLQQLDERQGLPPIGNYQILLKYRPSIGSAAAALRDSVRESFAAFGRAAPSRTPATA